MPHLSIDQLKKLKKGTTVYVAVRDAVQVYEHIGCATNELNEFWWFHGFGRMIMSFSEASEIFLDEGEARTCALLKGNNYRERQIEMHEGIVEELKHTLNSLHEGGLKKIDFLDRTNEGSYYHLANVDYQYRKVHLNE